MAKNIVLIVELEIAVATHSQACDVANEILRPHLPEHAGEDTALVDYTLYEKTTRVVSA